MQEGLQEAIALANQVIKTVPAYQKFLKRHGHKNKILLKKEEFFNIPISDKKNYIQTFALFDFLATHNWPTMAYSSSGSSGKPTFWLRDKKQSETGGKIHEKIFSQIFKIKKNEPTLAIICFSMGVWVAGNYTASSCQWVAEQGYQLTTITPGIEKHDIFHILKNLAPKFKNVILAGYPSFVMDLLVESKKTKIHLPKNLKIITAGDSFSEQWRDSVLKLIGNSKLSLNSIVSIYGSADAGIIGFETPLSIFLRKTALKNKHLYLDLFGKGEKEPALLQFYPQHIYIESQKGELLLTSPTSIPLIRYNIHDTGKVLNFGDIKKLLEKYNLISQIKKHLTNEWRLPFIVKYGRTDVAVTFYALNIYPEHIQAGLNDKKITELLSGNFRAYNKTGKNNREERLYLEFELAEKKIASQKMVKKISNTIVENLLKINTEFRKLHATIGERAIPRIKLLKDLGSKKLSHSKVLVGSKNKKAKIIL